MQKLLRLSQIIDRINQSIGQLTLWLVLIMIIVGVWNVIGRYRVWSKPVDRSRGSPVAGSPQTPLKKAMPYSHIS